MKVDIEKRSYAHFSIKIFLHFFCQECFAKSVLPRVFCQECFAKSAWQNTSQDAGYCIYVFNFVINLRPLPHLSCVQDLTRREAHRQHELGLYILSILYSIILFQLYFSGLFA